MSLEAPAKKASFLTICRSNYFNDIRPADAAAKKLAGYAEAVAVAQAEFGDGRQEAFRAYLAEAKYLANLWAAHLFLEYGHPGAGLVKECLAVIERYAADPFDKALAKQEQLWLKTYSQAGQET